MANPTNAHTEVPGSGHKPGLPQFDKETFPSQLLWFVVCFVALYLIVWKLALPRVGAILAERRGKIDGDLREAARFKGEADGALAAYEKALEDARTRGHAIASEMRDRLTAEAEKNRKALEDNLAAKLAVADRTIASTKAAAMANVAGIAADAAAAIVERLIGTTPPGAAVKAAVDEAMKR
jgi:F-type H+-transporting ATPase subunit b